MEKKKSKPDYTFMHVYDKAKDDNISYPPKSYHVVKYKDKYYVAEGHQIVTLKKDTKQEAFEKAKRLADTNNYLLMAFVKVPKSDPPRYRMKHIG